MQKLFAWVIGISISLASVSIYALTLTTNAFPDSGMMPNIYSCDGNDVAPKLTWANAPANTKSFAVIMSDPDAPNGIWYHWLVYNIPVTVNELGGSSPQLPAGALFGKNSWGKMQYSGPCPPKGSTHRYVFTVYALNAILDIPAGISVDAFLTEIKGHLLQTSNISGRFGR